MTKDDEIYKIRCDKLQKETNEVIEKILNFDILKSTPDDLNNLNNKLKELTEEVEDLIIELEVEDFLINGSWMENKNI